MGRRRKSRGINWGKIKWGSLARWLKRHEKDIRRHFGKSPFTKTGEINDNVLRRIYRDVDFLKRVSGSHWKRIRKKIQFKLYVLKG